MTNDEKKAKGAELAQRLFAGADSDGGASLPEPLLDYTLTHVFGDLWQQDTLSLQEREIATSTILVALNREAEQRLHFVAARNLGIERVKIEAIITHAAYYAGWPVAVSAARVLSEVWPAEE